mgnify:CR=1 FL=1
MEPEITGEKGMTCADCGHDHAGKAECECGCGKEGAKTCADCTHEHGKEDGSCDCGCDKK